LLAPDGKILNAVYSSGPIGRLVAEDVIGMVTYLKSQARPQSSAVFIFDLFWRRDVLDLAVTKGPIFLRDLNKVHEDIFLANLYSFVEMVR